MDGVKKIHSGTLYRWALFNILIKKYILLRNFLIKQTYFQIVTFFIGRRNEGEISSENNQEISNVLVLKTEIKSISYYFKWLIKKSYIVLEYGPTVNKSLRISA